MLPWKGLCWMLILLQVSPKKSHALTLSAFPNDWNPSLSRPSELLKYWRKGRNICTPCILEENCHHYTSSPPPVPVWEDPNDEVKVLTQPSSIKVKKNT